MVQINISISIPKALFLAIAFSAFSAMDTFAQGEERNRNIPESKVEDNFGSMESPEANIMDYSVKTPSTSTKDKSIPASVPNKNSALYKQTGEKDIRKENVSTLSFNLFLYIVDKFKED